ncbi:MAG: hypothetical protein KF778_03645 [Rhodocyclaceae bacterium]|nr:hypothetical protein [Rhodocyclaceae bacterium]MBX3667472.1 hypothetical protein [Rhodocyclaceae bacterium]
MSRSLSARLGLMLMGLFALLAAVLVATSQQMFELQRLPHLAAELALGSIAFTLAAALLVFHFFTRRLRQLEQALDRFGVADLIAPVRLAWARPDGDEIDRLAFNFGALTLRIAEQLRMLERTDRERRELLANVSHDLRTPLASMQGYLEMLLLRHGSLPPEEERNYLEVAAKHTERLGRLVNELFELTKLEADRVELQKEVFPLAELAQDVAQKLKLRAHTRGVEIVTHFGAASPSVTADIGMVERVLENLIDNAVRHTPEGGKVSVDLAAVGERVEVCVADTGRGIAASDLPYVFDRYYRADRTEGEKATHAGLGLAITQRIVALHGGAIRVESRIGEGTRFIFDLPAAPRWPAAREAVSF